MSGFTPGPWQVSGVRHSGDLKLGRDARLHAVGPDGDAVAMVFYDMKTGKGLKDAKLIAAAPEMLQVLQDLFVTGASGVQVIFGGNPIACNTLEARCREVIAKAAGEQS